MRMSIHFIYWPVKRFPFFLRLAINHNSHLSKEIADKILGIDGMISNDRLIEIKRKYPNAYNPWTEDEDKKLKAY